MSNVIMTGNGPLDPPPQLSQLSRSEAYGENLHSAYGNNGYWYTSIEDIEAIGQRIKMETFQPMVLFATFISGEERGREARKDWNRRLGPTKVLHVHFKTDQPGFEGTWAITDLAQAYATRLDPSFDMHTQAVYRQATSDHRHADEDAARLNTSPVANLTTMDVRAIGTALVQIADRQDALSIEVQEIRQDVSEVRQEVSEVRQEVLGRVDNLEAQRYGQRMPPPGWHTVAEFLRAANISLTRGRGEAYSQLCRYVREAMRDTEPVHVLRPNARWPDEYVSPEGFRAGLQRWRELNPRLL